MEQQQRPKCECGRFVTFVSQEIGYRAKCKTCLANETIIKKYGSRQNFEKQKRKPPKKPLAPVELKVSKNEVVSLIEKHGKGVARKMLQVGYIIFERYLKENNIQSLTNNLKSKEAKQVLENKEELGNLYKTLSQQQIAERLGIAQSTVGLYLNDHGISTTKWFARSSYEVEIKEYIKSIYDGMIKTSDRTVIKPKEIDILIPEKKLGIEFNGLFWHSSTDTSIAGVHLSKTDAAEAEGYQLLHIFENEWRNKKDVWKSVIANKLGHVEERIYARKCEVKEVPFMEARNFFNETHLQGGSVNGKTIGLYHDNKLVSALMFGSSRFEKNILEIFRFSNALFTSVVGGFSKLMKRMPEDVKIVSYANRRWSTGNLYEKCGFEFEKKTAPNYFFLTKDRVDLMPRQYFQKHKMKDIPDFQYDATKTADENLQFNNVRRIYDCGNIRYTLSHV